MENMNIDEMITAYYHVAKGAGKVTPYERMVYTADSIIKNHTEYVIRCFPSREGSSIPYSSKDLWLYITESLR